jgi:ABC-2 type transport system permease protein
MAQVYSNRKAMWAITKASFRAMLRSPSAIVFGIMFPLIFILVFGFLGSGGAVSLDVGLDPRSDTTGNVYAALRQLPAIKFSKNTPEEDNRQLERGNLEAILLIEKNPAGGPAYTIRIKTSDAVNPQNVEVLRSMLNAVVTNINEAVGKSAGLVAYASVSRDIEKVKGRIYRRIDFILPGQLGFSLLGSGVFGVAFLFFNLRQTLVLKRFFATPISKAYIVFGEGIARVIFQLLTAVIILGIGHFVFKFTLVHGWITFAQMLFLSLVGLLIFMGFGFIVSGVAKSESTIPPFANLITMPQFLLAGTFFPVAAFPSWLQPLCNVLPLTHLNTAMRKIAFEGVGLWDIKWELGILAIWGVVVYAVAVKVFKWE